MEGLDTFRGAVDPSKYQNYILTMLFLKYVSDVWHDHYDKVKKVYGDDQERILQAAEARMLPVLPSPQFSS